jgi:Tfp pilus assembly protein PilO
MEMRTALQPSAYEQVLVSIVRTLPAERVVQILDYARYIQSQAIEDMDDDETEEEILADEAHWDAQFAATQEGLKKMADKVRADIRAGRTRPMVFTKDGRIAPG